MIPVAVIALCAAAPDPVAAAAARLDRHLEADWTARNIVPAAAADDAEYLRRVYLDVIGRGPRVAEARAFLADPAADKRDRLLEKLLATPAHAAHFAFTTRVEWLPQTLTDQRLSFNGPPVTRWLRKQYAANTPMDEVVRKLLTLPVVSGPRGMIRDRSEDAKDQDAADIENFYQANEVKPENLGSTVSRVFVGVKLECAQCHDHPFAPYPRAQFWQFAAFFGEFTPLPPLRPSFVGPLTPQFEKNRIGIPGTERVAVATFADGGEPDWVPERTPREELARWLTDRKNPFFARTMANRTWARFFGVGLIDPVDEPGDSNPPSHPELLDELTRLYADSGFDNRFLIRVIAKTRAYGLTSRQTHPTQSDPRRLAKMNLKALTGLQIYDSLMAATGNTGDGPDNFDIRFGPRGTFGTMFPVTVKPTDAQTSILQALRMMNGAEVANETNADRSRLLAAVVDAPFFDTKARVETLFLAALGRLPTDDEAEKYGSYIDRGGPAGDKKQAAGDVFWVLLNGTEFLFNH